MKGEFFFFVKDAQLLTAMSLTMVFFFGKSILLVQKSTDVVRAWTFFAAHFEVVIISKQNLRYRVFHVDRHKRN